MTTHDSAPTAAPTSPLLDPPAAPRPGHPPHPPAPPAPPDVGEGVERALDGLLSRGVLTPSQAQEVAAALAPPAGTTPATGAARTGLSEVTGYLGGALVAGAAALFLFTSWPSLGTAGRVTSLAAIAAVLVLAGAALVRRVPPARLRSGDDPRRRRLVSTLWGFAACSLGGAAGVAASSGTGTGDGDPGLLVGGLTVLIAGVGAYALVPGAAGQLVVWIGGLTAWTGLVDLLQIGDSSPMYGIGYVAIGTAGVALAVRGIARERTLAGVVGVLAALLGGQLPLIGETDEVAYVLTAAVAVAGFAAYLRLRDWPLLAGGVLAATLVVPEVAHDVAGDTLSAPGILLLAGVTLLAASAAGLRVRSLAR